MKDRWSVELADEEWALVYKALIHCNETTLPNVSAKDIAKKIFETRKSIIDKEKESLSSEISKG